MLVIALVLHLAGGGHAFRTAVTVTIGLGIGFFSVCLIAERRLAGVASRAGANPKTEVALPSVTQKQATSEAGPLQATAALGREQRRMRWAAAEVAVDGLIDAAIHLINLHVRTHTTAVFFPTLDGGYMLRRFHSPSASIDAGAIIYPGIGVIGKFLKDGVKRFALADIVSDSATLFYYSSDAKVRSLMASPIAGDGSERGLVVVDFLEPESFTDDDHSFLDAVASLLGEAVYGCYMHTEHALQHCRLAAVSSIEKEFFRNVSRQSIVDSIVEVVRTALPCDRVTVSMRNDDDTSATIVAAWGDGADALMKTRFDLGAKSLASVVYTNNMLLSRSFSSDRYEVRYFDGEPDDDTLGSFIAAPLGVDRCRGLVLVESRNTDAYDEDSRELTGRLCTSAGLAIEKMIVFEKANALATHDGLTGLFNHRTFQQLLADEITRAIRYNEPVSLIICDIDFFKKVNDTYGHPFGDVVLRGVAALLENSVRQDIDTVARYGGEEFALILVKTDSKGACETAERIRSAIERQSFSARSGVEVRVSMSFGIAEYRKHARQINELIGKADKALYRAKENGRNRVELY